MEHLYSLKGFSVHYLIFHLKKPWENNLSGLGGWGEAEVRKKRITIYTDLGPNADDQTQMTKLRI